MMRLGVGALDIRESAAFNGLEFAVPQPGLGLGQPSTTLDERDVAELRDQLNEWLEARAPHLAGAGR